MHTHTHTHFWFAVFISVSLSVHEEIIGLVAGLNEIVLLKTLYSPWYRVDIQYNWLLLLFKYLFHKLFFSQRGPFLGFLTSENGAPVSSQGYRQDHGKM